MINKEMNYKYYLETKNSYRKWPKQTKTDGGAISDW
jgi:hypothetical protein